MNTKELLSQLRRALNEGSWFKPFEPITNGVIFDTPVLAVSASGVLTFSAAPANGDTITIGNMTYTFKTVLDAWPLDVNEVLIGATADATAAIANLIAAIYGDPEWVGTTYGTGTKANPYAGSLDSTATTLIFATVTPGVIGNTIPTASGSTVASWATPFLTGGVDGTIAQSGQQYANGAYLWIAVEENTISHSNWVQVAAVIINV